LRPALPLQALHLAVGVDADGLAQRLDDRKLTLLGLDGEDLAAVAVLSGHGRSFPTGSEKIDHPMHYFYCARWVSDLDS
jgi:hypothetical protein